MRRLIAIRERPRVLAGLALALIAAASVVALAWPLLPFNQVERAFVGPTSVGIVIQQLESPGSAARVGQLAPDFEWVTPEGGTLRLSSLRGQTVAVNFWATWCEPCREELPALDRVAKSRPDLVVLALDLDESGEKVRSFFDSIGIERVRPVLDIRSETAKRYGVLGLPTTFFIDPTGVVRHVEMRGLSEQLIREGVERAR